MIDLSRILCPLDLSSFSARALHHAVALGRWYSASVTALAVRPLPPPMLWQDYPPTVALELPEDVSRFETEVRAFVAREAPGAAVDVRIVPGPVGGEIVRVARELPADLIVMGTHGRTGFEHMMLGSVAEHVLRRAPCPVMTVPRTVTPAHEAPAIVYRTILCAVDFTEAAEAAARQAVALALEAGSRLVLLHVLEGLPAPEWSFAGHPTMAEIRAQREQDARQHLESLVPKDAKTWCVADVAVTYGRASREILARASALDADLIVLGARRRLALDRVLFGATAEHVLRAATCPVLTVPHAVGPRESKERERLATVP